uniref:Hexosyltransferase n=1 Tax=Lygus hesperus TaxID=30085 RepID=A0A0A9XJK2_LYGHE
MTVPVRRHAYLQQQYTGVTIREIRPEKDNHSESNHITDSSSLTIGIKNVLDKSINRLSRNLPALLFSPHSPLAMSQTESYESINDRTINFILPLSGRFDTFRRFVQNFETVCLNNREKVSLMVIMFPSEQENTTQRIIDTIRGLQKQYPNTQIRYVSLYENFARARALSVGATHYESRDLLFFIDVDIVWRTEALRRIRRHTLSGASVYYPIVFSEFDPQRVYRQGVSPNHFAISERAGYWRQYGFGNCSMYKSDLEKVGGFNTSIVGWGKEDVDLFEKFVKFMPGSKLRIFRAPDPDLVHVYHPVVCNSKLGVEQLAMCKASRADSYSSMNLLEEELRQRSYNGVR